MRLLPKKLAFDAYHMYLDPVNVDISSAILAENASPKWDSDSSRKRHLTSASLRQALQCLCFGPDFADHPSILVVGPRKTMAFDEKVTTHVQR